MLFTRKPKWIAFVFVIFFSAVHILSFSQETIYGKGWTIVDCSGKMYATALDYFDIQEFHKGAAKAQLTGGFCLIDIHGAKAFGNKIFPDKYYIDTRGNRVDSPVEKDKGTDGEFIAKEYKEKTYLDREKRWQLFDLNGNLLFNNVFATSRFGEPNQFSEGGYAALKIENQEHICDGIKGPSPWGAYEIDCTRAKASEASYDLGFDNLGQQFNIDENERSFRLTLGPEEKETIDLEYKLEDGLVYLDTVKVGRQFFRPGEITKQKGTGIPYFDARDMLKVVIDQFMFLLEPEILFRRASPGTAELRRGGYLYVNGVRQKGLDEMETINFEGGQSYTGETENDQFSGYGKYVFKDGSVHYGTFSNNTFNGWGLRILEDERSFLGVFSGNTAEGYLLQHTGYGEAYKRLLTDGEYDGRVLAKLLNGQIEIRKIESNEIVSTEVLRASPDFGGIGISYRYFDEKNGYYAENVGRGFPAYKAGMEPGDRLVEIDGETVEGMNLKEVSDKLKGPHGSIVKVTVERQGQQIELVITRERIEVDKLGSGTEE